MFRRDFLRICAALAGSLGFPWRRPQAVPEKERWLSWSGSRFDLLAPPELGTGHLRVDLSGSMSQLCELLDSTHGLLRWKYDEHSGGSRRVPVSWRASLSRIPDRRLGPRIDGPPDPPAARHRQRGG